MKTIIFWIEKVLPVIFELVQSLIARKRKNQVSMLKSLNCICLTDRIDVDSEMYSESVSNSGTVSTRTISLDAPEIENAKGLQFVWSMSSVALTNCIVTVDIENSIFGDGAEYTVTPDSDANTVTVHVEISECDAVTALGHVMVVHFSNLTSTQIASITDGGDVIMVIVSNF